MQDPNQTTRISNRLFIPDHRLSSSFTLVLCLASILLYAEVLVGFADWEDEKKGICGAGDEREEVGILDAEDVVEREGWGEAEFVD